MIHRLPGRQNPIQPRKGGGRIPRPRCMGDIIAQQSNGKDPPSVTAIHAPSRVEREHVETNRVSWLHFPPENPVSVPHPIDVREIVQGSLREPFRLSIEEGARHEPRSQVGTSHKFQCRFPTHGVDGDPEAAILPAVDVVVWLVLMPGSALPSPGLLGQHMIVIESHLGALHQLTRHLAKG